MRRTCLLVQIIVRLLWDDCERGCEEPVNTLGSRMLAAYSPELSGNLQRASQRMRMARGIVPTRTSVQFRVEDAGSPSK